MTSGSTGSIFPKWQLAILLGAPVALGLGYLYYKHQSTPIEEDETDGRSKKKLSNLKDKTISLDGDEKLTVIEKAAKEEKEKVVKQKAPLDEAIDYKNEGNLRFKSGKYNEAIELYDKAIQACPGTHSTDLSTFYQNRAAAYEQLKHWTAVRNDCTRALELNPRYVKALHRRARAAESSGDLIGSLEDITATCILEGFAISSSLEFADRVLKKLGRRDASEAFKQRTIVFPSPNFIKTYFASFSNDPVFRCTVETSDNVVGFARAIKAMDNCEYDVVIPACTAEIESNTDTAQYKLEATLLRGTFNLLIGSMAEALNDFNAIISNESNPIAFRSNALVKRASLNVQSEQYTQGFEDFHTAEKLDPENGDIYHQRGQVHTLLEQLSEANADFEKAVKFSPDSCSAYVQKCYAEYRTAFFAKNQVQLYNAMQSCQKAITMFPESIESVNVLAQILTEQQQFDKADELFEKAIALAPTTASLYVHRGLLYLQWNGDIKKALEYLNKAIEVDDKCELAYETLGTIQVQRGMLENAVELFEKALKLTRSELEMVHLYSLRNAAKAQLNVAKKLGLDLSSLSPLAASSSF